MAGSLNPLASIGSLFEPAKPRSASPDVVKRRRALADALAQEATRGDAGSLIGAIGKGLQGFAAGRERDAADAAEAAGQREAADLLNRYGAGGGQAAPMAMPGSVPGVVATPGAMPAPVPRAAPASGGGRSDRTNPQEVYSGLVARGVPSMVAAGMVGNIGAESDFRLAISDNRGEGSTGFIQARGSRLTDLQRMGAETGRPAFGLYNQLDHIVSEFQGPEKRAFELAQRARTPGEAAIVLAKHYERPAAWALRDSAPKRAGLAETIFRQSQADPSSFMSAEPARMGAVADPGSLADTSPARPGAVADPRSLQMPARRADMPVEGAQPVGMTAMGDQDGTGYFIPPGPEPMPAAPVPPDDQPIEPPAVTLPEIAVAGGPGGMPMPMPPPRPIDAELFAPEGAPVAQPSTAQASMPPEMAAQSVPLPPPRPADADLYAAQADMPAVNAVPASMPGLDPNSRDAGAGDFARREGMPGLVGGLQDGLDRIFGGAQTQARLDQEAQGRQRLAVALGGDISGQGVPPRNRIMAEALTRQADPAAQSVPSPGPSREALAGALGAAEISPQAQRLASALDPSAGQGAAPGQVPDGSVPQPTAYAQAPGQTQAMPDARRQDLLALANNEYATPQVRQFALDQLSPKLNNVDMGDSIGFVDQGGNLVRSYPKTRAPMNVPQGNVLADPNTGREIYRNPKEPEQTPDQRNYAAAKQEGFAGDFNSFLQQKSQRQGQAVQVDLPDGRKMTMFYDPVENRLKTPEQMGMTPPPATSANPYVPPGPKLTESEALSGGYASRMAEAHSLINGLESQGLRGVASAASKVPVVGNYLVDADMQRYAQAKRDFSSAVLRKESGAAISQGEYAEMDKKYFPQPGEKPETIEQKRRSRETAIEGFMGGAGGGYRPPESYKPLPKQAPAAVSAPSGAVEMLRSNPDSYRQQFDAKYGKGAADRTLGGR